MSERALPTSLFPSVEVSTTPPAHTPHPHGDRTDHEMLRLLRDMVAAQDRQNELLEELIGQMNAGQKQRNQELSQWRNANPELAQKCRVAAEVLSQVQSSFLTNLADEVDATGDSLADGEFMLSEFVDRYGPRLAHLNGVLQVLAQLGTTPTT